MAAEKIIMYSSWVIFYSICPAVSSNDVALPGHLMPLGSHQAADTIAFVDGFPQPEQFFDMFDKNSKAVVFRGACKDFTATRMWSDEFLRFVCYYMLYFHLTTFSLTFCDSHSERRSIFSSAIFLAYHSYL